MAASHAASLPTLPKWDQSLQPTACCTARAFQSFLSLAYLHHQLLNIPEAQLNAAAQGWDGGMRTCHAGARLISSSIPIHIYPFLHFTAAAVKRGEQFPKGLGASAAAQHIDPGVSAVCNTALLSNTAHHGHSRSSGHDAQELMGWWAYCMHRSIPKRIERRWHASDSRDAPLSVCVWFPWTTRTRASHASHSHKIFVAANRPAREIAICSSQVDGGLHRPSARRRRSRRAGWRALPRRPGRCQDSYDNCDAQGGGRSTQACTSPASSTS